MESPQAPAPDLAPGDVIAGKFRLERLIGRGGMGSVWAARHVQLDMPLALKFIESESVEGPSLDMPDARARFEREARAAGQIRSPHVVSIIDHGIDQAGGRDRPYIAMELLEGEDLGERLRREGRISVAAAARILSQAAKALRRAHEAGIIHRDLKPGNVFLARFDDDEVVKLLDFGVAKMRRSGVLEEQLMTQTGIVFGSPSYMSPEQARGARSIDHRSDLWSLAVILFRAVTGVKPFQASSIADLVIKLCIDPLPVASHVASDLPPGLDGFFTRAFARDPDQRFASAVEMAAAFEAAASASAPAVSWPHATAAAPLPIADEASSSGGAATSALPASFPAAPGSGPHVAFAPGTLTPPPRPARPGSSEVTPGSGVAAIEEGGAPRTPAPALPSGGWRIGLPTAAPFAPASYPAGTLPLPAGTHGASAATVPLPKALGAGRARIVRYLPPSTLERVKERSPAILVTSLGGGLILAVVLAVVARQSPRAVTPETIASAVPAVAPAVPVMLPPPSAAAAAAAEPEPSARATANGATVADPPPEASGSAAAEPAPPASASATPRAPVRSGRKWKPNFGY